LTRRCEGSVIHPWSVDVVAVEGQRWMWESRIREGGIVGSNLRLEAVMKDLFRQMGSMLARELVLVVLNSASALLKLVMRGVVLGRIAG
jgi:hypothetical protein